MTYLKILFFILATPIVAQDYSSRLDLIPVNSKNSFLDISEAKNLPEEDLYFDSYLLPIERAYELQKALDTYGSVRLEKGTYPGNPIVLKSDQKLIGHPKITKLNFTVSIKSGSTKVRIQDVDPKDLIFESGAPIKNCVFKTLQYTRLTCTNCFIEDNLFINMDKCAVRFDCSSSGYFRNNRFIKLWTHSAWPQTVMKGNNETPSYGNVVLWRNYLIPNGDATNISGLESLTLVGVDAESWNYKNLGDKSLLFMRNIESLKIGSFSGLNHGKYPTPVFDIEAKNLLLFGKNIYSRSEKDTVRPGTNVIMMSGRHEDYVFRETKSTLNLKAYFNNKDITLNNEMVTGIISGTNANRIENILVNLNVSPWERPSFDNLPMPVSSAQMASRANKKDQSAFIQELINTQGIAELDEGIYYIAKPIIITREQGIIGKGSGKTAIVGITDDFPLILGRDDVSKTSKTSSKYFLAHLTLQGGEKGLYVNPMGKEKKLFQLTSCTFKNIIFRNQRNAMHFDKFYGVDNNFFDNVSFVDCEIGIYQEPKPGFDVNKGETSTMMYMDKNVFYNCQIIRCKVGFSLLAKRPNNLNAWIDCNFDQNIKSVDLNNQINPVFANCDFKNHAGDYIIGREKSSSFYNCNFFDNTSKSIFRLGKAYIEGCNFLDNIPLFSELKSEAFIMNSTVKSTLGTLSNGLFLNNTFENVESLNYLLAEIKNKEVITILAKKSNPVPQFLVKYY